jgi:hypothetical protein
VVARGPGEVGEKSETSPFAPIVC